MEKTGSAPSWLAAALEAGRADLAAGRVVDAEEVFARWEREDAEIAAEKKPEKALRRA